MSLPTKIFIKAYKLLGYKEYDTSDYKDGFEKVAIYANNSYKPAHAARQLSTGKWTSKLSMLEDIEHSKPDDISGSNYGKVVKILKRKTT